MINFLNFAFDVEIFVDMNVQKNFSSWYPETEKIFDLTQPLRRPTEFSLKSLTKDKFKTKKRYSSLIDFISNLIKKPI